MKTRISILRPLILLSLLLFSLGAVAEEGTDDKPFAEKHVVLQISDPNPFKQTLVLNVANNLIKHYGQDKIDIEIVAFGCCWRTTAICRGSTDFPARAYASLPVPTPSRLLPRN
ncbi:hypothetical protein [Thiolapillus sp.]